MGKFTGLTDQEWGVVEPLIPYKWGITYSGKQPLHPRKILNTLIWILTTGARWCDVPVGAQWASRACAHKYLGKWKENGTLEQVLTALQEIGIEWKLIDLTRLAVDGFFPLGKAVVKKWTMATRERGLLITFLLMVTDNRLGLQAQGLPVTNEKK